MVVVNPTQPTREEGTNLGHVLGGDGGDRATLHVRRPEFDELHELPPRRRLIEARQVDLGEDGTLQARRVLLPLVLLPVVLQRADERRAALLRRDVRERGHFG